MLTLLIIVIYMDILIMLVRQGLRGYKLTKANFSHFSKWGAPRFTCRERNGRFKANKVGLWYLATQGI